MITTFGGEIQYSGLVRLDPGDFEHTIRHLFEQMTQYVFFGPVFFAQLGPDLEVETERLRVIASPNGQGRHDAIGMLVEVVRIGGLFVHAAGQTDEPRQDVHLLGSPEVITRLDLEPRATTR